MKLLVPSRSSWRNLGKQHSSRWHSESMNYIYSLFRRYGTFRSKICESLDSAHTTEFYTGIKIRKCAIQSGEGNTMMAIARMSQRIFTKRIQTQMAGLQRLRRMNQSIVDTIPVLRESVQLDLGRT